MSKRTDIKTILIIGSGPIVIGQACEFDYSGTQACKALKEEGYRVVLVNSNPATIMTDPQMADVTYIEPLVPEILEKIIAKERPDALLPTLGGQTGLNLSVELYNRGILQKYGVELIGADAEAIEKGEDREKFRASMLKIGLDVPLSVVVHSLKEALEWADKHKKYPLIIRPSFTLGGTGGGIAYNRDEFERMALFGLNASPAGEILIEESLLGWKELGCYNRILRWRAFGASFFGRGVETKSERKELGFGGYYFRPTSACSPSCRLSTQIAE